MKKIKHIDLTPDLNEMLASIIFEDDSKLAVTVNVSNQPFNSAFITADSILAAIECQIGLRNGELAGSRINDFYHEVSLVLDGNALYKVTADHPILARPDQSKLSGSQARQYAFELASAGYENVATTRCN